VGSGGESLGEELIKWGQETLGLTINEFYGQTGRDATTQLDLKLKIKFKMLYFSL
jgi:acyl-coenzyme A synthetase/AMP-(fatty) acid ligase